MDAIKKYFDDFLKWCIKQLEAFVDWCIGLIVTLIDAVINVIKDIFVWLFESILNLIIFILNLIDLSALEAISPMNYISSLPADVRNVMGVLGIDVATGMIVGAIVIRLLLQLIPFVRLGS